jgi:predicted AAA+ superfamily ATPase
MKALWSKPTVDLGAKLETLVFLELRSRDADIYYMNDNSKEIDFCIVENGKPKTFIQACYELSIPKTREREVRALLELGKKYSVTDLQIVTMDEEDQIKVGGSFIKVWPAYRFCLGI